MSELTLVPGSSVDAEAAHREAWGIIADAYGRAVEVQGLDPEHRGTLVRCLAQARRLAVEDIFDLVKGGA